MNPIDLRGQGHNRKKREIIVNRIAIKALGIKLGTDVGHDARMNLIDFGGQR